MAFPPVNQGWLAWIALIPLICATWFGQEHLAFEVWRLKFGVSPNPSREKETPNPKPQTPNLKRLRPAALGYVSGLAFFTTTFSWLGELGPLFGNSWLRLLPLLLALYLGLYFAFWAWFLAWLLPRRDAQQFVHSGRNLAIGALGASAWVAQEWVRGWLFTGFGWNNLGVALHDDLAMIQIADHTGVAGLSWLVAFCNLLAVLIVRRLVAEIGPTFLKRIRWEFSATVTFVVIVWAYGTRTMLRGDATPTVPLRVAAIQANIPQREKFDLAQEDEIFAQFDRLTGLAQLLQPPPQLVLWPESATPRGLFDDELNHDFVFAQARRLEGALLLGSTDFDLERNEDFNIAALLTDQAGRLQIYRKIHLVPFGEYLPLRPLFGPIVGPLVAADFTRGREFTLLELSEPAIKFSALICFEDTLGYLSRHFVAAGAQALVNITNDGWFGRSAAAHQHLANAVFRAVENRRPLIRCANTGVTGLVNRTGFVERWVPEFQEGIAVREVAIPVNAPRTFFTRHGDLVSPASAASALLSIVGGWIARRRAAANSPLRA